METTRVLMDAANFMDLALNRESRASANVYFPSLRKGSATRNKATTQPARYPIEYRKPS